MTAALYGAAKAVLFRLGGGDAETAHEWTLARLASASHQPRVLAAPYSAAVTAFPGGAWHAGPAAA